MVLDTMKYRKRNRDWQKKYAALAPKAGDIAPDFELYDANGESPVRLNPGLGNNLDLKGMS